MPLNGSLVFLGEYCLRFSGFSASRSLVYASWIASRIASFFAISMASLSVTGCRGAMNVAGMSVSGYWFGLRNCLCCLMLMGCVSMNSGRFIFCFFFLLFGGVWGVGSIGLPSVGSLSCHSNV